MESATLIRQNFIIWAENIDAARDCAGATLRHLIVTHEGFSSTLDIISRSWTIEDMFEELGFDIVQRPDKSIVELQQRTHEIWSRENISVWEALAPAVREDSFLLFHTEDDQVIRFKFARELYVQQGDFIFHGNLAWK